MKRYLANWLFWHAPDWVIEAIGIALPYHMIRIINWATKHSADRDPRGPVQ